MKKIIAGVDEVGRGSLIGPVYAAAVILEEKIKRFKKIVKKKKRNIRCLHKKELYVGHWLGFTKRN